MYSRQLLWCTHDIFSIHWTHLAYWTHIIQGNLIVFGNWLISYLINSSIFRETSGRKPDWWKTQYAMFQPKLFRFLCQYEQRYHRKTDMMSRSHNKDQKTVCWIKPKGLQELKTLKIVNQTKPFSHVVAAPLSYRKAWKECLLEFEIEFNPSFTGPPYYLKNSCPHELEIF